MPLPAWVRESTWSNKTIPSPNRCHRSRIIGPTLKAVPYILGIAALVLPTMLVVQTLRGKVKPTCCAPPADRDLRLRQGDAP